MPTWPMDLPRSFSSAFSGLRLMIAIQVKRRDSRRGQGCSPASERHRDLAHCTMRRRRSASRIPRQSRPPVIYRPDIGQISAKLLRLRRYIGHWYPGRFLGQWSRVRVSGANGHLRCPLPRGKNYCVTRSSTTPAAWKSPLSISWIPSDIQWAPLASAGVSSPGFPASTRSRYRPCGSRPFR